MPADRALSPRVSAAAGSAPAASAASARTAQGPEVSDRRSNARIALIVALGVEVACVSRYVRPDTGTELRRSGPGAVRAGRAAESALASGAGALVSFGLAGSLDPALPPGSVVLPQAVLADGVAIPADPAWRARLAHDLGRRFTIGSGSLLASLGVLETPADKARAAAATGAIAADLESGAVADAAFRAGVPFVAIRVIADGIDDRLPPGIADWVDDNGASRPAPVLRAALTPWAWPLLWTLGRRWGSARRTLDELAQVLVANSFMFTDRSSQRL